MPQLPDTRVLGTPFIELQSVDSTNNYARQQIHAGLAQHGTAFFAHEQVNGKGQRGKIWRSEKDANIALSIIVKPQPFVLAQQFELSACVAVAVHHFFLKYAGDDTKIKWPNDLYWQDRKAGGILIESVIKNNAGVAEWEWAIVGIGININQIAFPPFLPNPVSLKQITGQDFETVILAKEFISILNKTFTELTYSGFENIYKQYLAILYKINEPVKFKKDNRVFEAIVKNVSPAGQLIIQHAIEEEIDFGTLEWVIN